MGENPDDREPGTLNYLLEDYLAQGATEEDHTLMLHAWLLLGAEYLARTAGRRFTTDLLDSLGRFVREAQPSRSWKP